jgi:hypothetical protein
MKISFHQHMCSRIVFQGFFAGTASTNTELSFQDQKQPSKGKGNDNGQVCIICSIESFVDSY